MESPFDKVLKSVKIFMEKNGAFAKDFEGQLNNIRKTEHHIQAIDQLIPDTEQPVEGKAQVVVVVRDVCKAVAYGNYIPLKAEATALTKIVKSMKIESLPATIRPIGIEIKGYVDEITAQLQKVDNVINEIAKMIEVFKENQYNISKMERIEVKMKTSELNSGLETCTAFQKQAAEALTNLRSEAQSYDERQTKSVRVKTVLAALSGVAAGAVTGGVGLAFGAIQSSATVAVGAGGAGGGVLSAASYGYLSYNSLISEYENNQAEINKLQSALKTLEVEQIKKHKKVEEKKNQLEEII